MLELNDAVIFFSHIIEAANIAPVQLSVEGPVKEALVLLCEAVHDDNIAGIEKLRKAHREHQAKKSGPI